MKSNYKRLGDYIERCDEFNEGMQVEELLGISNNKYFQKSHTNTIGIDLTGYRVVRNNQFAFNRATTRNGDKISIALREDTECMVSPSYRIFRVRDETKLNSEYLMMWFRRPEFDRYARFKSHGSAHEFFDWEEMCEVELPIPSIDTQREIVKEYNVIANKIKLNDQLTQKLEETAQTVYTNWFMNFEFPNDDGKPYKSSGGAMVFNTELEKEIPENWALVRFKDLIEVKYGKDYKHLEKGSIPLYGSGGVMSYVNKHLYDKPSILIPRKGSLNNILFLNKPFWSVDTMFYSIIKEPFSGYYAYYFLKQMDFNSLDVGSAVPSMTTEYLNNIPIIKPSLLVLKMFDGYLEKLVKIIEFEKEQSNKLNVFKNLLLSRLATIEN